MAQLSQPAPGAPIVPNSPAVLQQLQSSTPATAGLGLPPAPLSPRISIRTDQLPSEVGKGPRIGRYYLNRAEEDFSYLRDPSKSNDPFDPLKFIPLNQDKSIYLTLEGEERIRNEAYTKNSFSFVPPKHNDTLLFRHMYGADLHLGANVRAFVQIASGQEGGYNYGAPAGVNRNNVQVQQAFGEVMGNFGKYQVGVRAGRQELVLGSSLIFSTREPTNIPYSHDGVRVYVDDQDARIDAFVFDTVTNRIGELQDSSNAHNNFWGFYASKALPGVDSVLGAKARIFIDPFYVGYDARSTTNFLVRGDEARQTFGGRLWGQVGSADFDWTGDYQTGKVGPADVSAFAMFTNTGYTFDAPMQPRIGVRFDVASGGREGNTLRSYNPLFAALGAFTESSLIAPINLIDTALGVSFSPTPRLRVLGYATFYWRYAENDGVYNVIYRPFLNTTSPRVRGTPIGYQPAVRAAYVINDHVTLSAALAFFRVDGALHDAGAKNNLYSLTQLQFRF